MIAPITKSAVVARVQRGAWHWIASQMGNLARTACGQQLPARALTISTESGPAAVSCKSCRARAEGRPAVVAPRRPAAQGQSAAAWFYGTSFHGGIS